MEETGAIFIDRAYEFAAPQFFDFANGESEAETRNAELWFETAISHAPSPFMPRIKTGRSVIIESLCDFSEADQPQASKSADSAVTNCASETKPQSEMMPDEIKEEELIPNEAKEENNASLVNLVSADEEADIDKGKGGLCTLENGSASTEGAASAIKIKTSNGNKSLLSIQVETEASTPKQPTISHKENQIDLKKNLKAEKIGGTEACTPKPPMTSQKANLTDSKKHQTAKKIASLVKNPSALKSKNHSQLSQAKGIKPTSSARRDPRVKNPTATPNLAQEYQAIKRQKLEGGKTRQILNVRPQNLPHKGSSNLCPSTAKIRKEDRKVYVREAAVPFISMAEMMKKFQSNTREISLPNLNSSLSQGDASSIIQRRPKLTLTRPKEPELETTNRVRSVRVKSTAELEEEMMAKIPKFKARPLNKKILEAPTLPAVPRSTPQLPVFQEFHLETMARANQNAESSTVASTESSVQNHQWKSYLTEPKTPLLQTSLRARPPRVKSSVELEQEELEKVLPFKARPLNKKIFESKGGLGIFCTTKRQVTKPQEFHFATDERIPPQASITDLFDKLSLNSEPHRDNHPIPRITAPNPFHLHTEERGAEKETKFVMKVIEKQTEEEKARVPRANPYPYTTDYPVIPPKPEPKPCTKPEPFQLESLVRHEEEMQREMEERKRMEKEEAERRKFKAQPILKEDPIPLPEKARKPLTQVQVFNHHADHRAVDRAEFDEKVKEKEQMYKRYREESESAKMMEEEKALKQLRRTLVPHARAVPSFDRPFCPQKSSKETTKAKSPNLRVFQRRERRKMTCVVATASSAAANNMR